VIVAAGTREDSFTNGPETSPAERDDVAAELLGNGAPDAVDTVVRLYEPLVKHLASRFAHRGEPFEDLLQVANLALVKAASRFDPEAGTRFSSYAIPTILGEIKRHFRDSGWSVRVPRRLQERALRLRGLMETLPQRLGRSPTVAELAEHAGMDVDAVLEALEAGGTYRTDSIDENGGHDDALGRQVAIEDVRFDVIEGWVHVAPLLRRLPRREQALLYLRFVEELPQRRIADKLGISQMHVSRLLRRTLEDLRRATRP